jgi:hypothetical protein
VAQSILIVDDGRPEVLSGTSPTSATPATATVVPARRVAGDRRPGLSDIDMPGRTVCDARRSGRRPEVDVIAVTGVIDTDTALKAIRLAPPTTSPSRSTSRVGSPSRGCSSGGGCGAEPRLPGLPGLSHGAHRGLETRTAGRAFTRTSDAFAQIRTPTEHPQALVAALDSRDTGIGTTRCEWRASHLLAERPACSAGAQPDPRGALRDIGRIGVGCHPA